jgi:hypothetical protein
MLETKNPGTEAGAKGALVGSLKPSPCSEYDLQAQALEAKFALPPHMARCALCLLRGDVW